MSKFRTWLLVSEALPDPHAHEHSNDFLPEALHMSLLHCAGQSMVLDDGDQLCLLPSQPDEVLTLHTTSSKLMSMGDTVVGGRYSLTFKLIEAQCS